MKQKHTAGFSLIEVLVAIVLLGALVVPACSALVMTARMNAKSNDVLQARLAVSSAVETLLAEGIDSASVREGGKITRFTGVEVKVESDEDDPIYYSVTVQDTEGLVQVTTVIHAREGGT